MDDSLSVVIDCESDNHLLIIGDEVSQHDSLEALATALQEALSSEAA